MSMPIHMIYGWQKGEVFPSCDRGKFSVHSQGLLQLQENVSTKWSPIKSCFSSMILIFHRSVFGSQDTVLSYNPSGLHSQTPRPGAVEGLGAAIICPQLPSMAGVTAPGRCSILHSITQHYAPGITRDRPTHTRTTQHTHEPCDTHTRTTQHTHEPCNTQTHHATHTRTMQHTRTTQHIRQNEHAGLNSKPYLEFR